MGQVENVTDGGIATITFTNPPHGFLTSDMVEQLGRVMEEVENDPAVKAIIFTGGLPDVFIRHFSVEEIIAMDKPYKMKTHRLVGFVGDTLILKQPGHTWGPTPEKARIVIEKHVATLLATNP